MELLLQHGDHSRNGQGFLQEVDGAQQLVQRAMVRLTVPKGKFVLNPQLGKSWAQLDAMDKSWSQLEMMGLQQWKEKEEEGQDVQQ